MRPLPPINGVATLLVGDLETPGVRYTLYPQADDNGFKAAMGIIQSSASVIANFGIASTGKLRLDDGKEITLVNVRAHIDRSYAEIAVSGWFPGG